LSDAEWELVEPLAPAMKPGGRPALHQRREIVNALAYWLRAGCYRTTCHRGRRSTTTGAPGRRHHLAGGRAQRRGMRRCWAPAAAPPRVVPRFAVAPRRRVVERTFAWLGRYRRLAKDYECLPATAENTVCLAMALTLTRRLARAPA
jgi:transposase